MPLCSIKPFRCFFSVWNYGLKHQRKKLELKSLEAKKTISVPSRELTYPLQRHFWVDDFPLPHVHPRELTSWDPGNWHLEMILFSRGLSLLQWINCTEVRVRQRCLQKRHVSFTFSAGECLISVRWVLNRNNINHYWYKCRELLWVFFATLDSKNTTE